MIIVTAIISISISISLSISISIIIIVSISVINIISTVIVSTSTSVSGSGGGGGGGGERPRTLRRALAFAEMTKAATTSALCARTPRRLLVLDEILAGRVAACVRGNEWVSAVRWVGDDGETYHSSGVIYARHHACALVRPMTTRGRRPPASSQIRIALWHIHRS